MKTTSIIHLIVCGLAALALTPGGIYANESGKTAMHALETEASPEQECKDLLREQSKLLQEFADVLDTVKDTQTAKVALVKLQELRKRNQQLDKWEQEITQNKATCRLYEKLYEEVADKEDALLEHIQKTADKLREAKFYGVRNLRGAMDDLWTEMMVYGDEEECEQTDEQ